jgi:hypothetical protein
MIKEEDLPMPADQLVRVLHALIEGLVFQRLLTPELVPDETFRAAFAVLAMNPHRESQRLPNILGVDRR